MEERNTNQWQRNFDLNKVRKKLFHDEDDDDSVRQNSNNRIAEEMQVDMERKKEKWNFDFKHGVPQPGRYQWTKIDQLGNEDPASTVNNEENEKMQIEQVERAESSRRRSREDNESEGIAAKRFKR